MMKTLKNCFIVIFSMVFVYGLGSFVEADFDIRAWTKFTRANVGMLMGFAFVMSNIYIDRREAEEE